MTKGFVCTCGEKHRFPPYVYAHWRIRLVFTCPKCKRKWNILDGVASNDDTVAEELRK